MEKKQIVIAACLFTFGMASCELVIDLNIPAEEPKLVVNSLFNPDSTWNIFLSTSRHILSDSNFTPVLGAQVRILDEAGNELILLGIGNGNYRSDAKPESEKQYVVEVAAPGFETVVAHAHAPERVFITAVKVDSARRRDGVLPIDITFKDPEGQENHYQVSFLVEAVSQFRINGVVTSTDTALYSIPLSLEDPDQNDNFGEEQFVHDTFFNGKEHTITVYSYNNPAGTILWAGFILNNVSDDYYQYMNSLNLQRRTNGDPFAQPVLVFNNVEKGFGIFAGYSSSFFEVK